MPIHDLPRELEVAAQQLAGVLRVALFRCGGEAHQVHEQHRDQPALGDGRRRNRNLRDALERCRGRDVRKGGSTLAAELGAGRVDGAAHGARHRQARSAFRAELAAFLVRRSAAGAGQHGIGPPRGQGTFI